MKSDNQTFIAFLRGINVGGHHKVPMAELKTHLSNMGFENIITILNSGNVIFDSAPKKEEKLEQEISVKLETVFGFNIPVLIRNSDEILKIIDSNPFENHQLTKDKRFYISFLKNEKEVNLKTPWISDDNSFEILSADNKSILSILDISVTGTPKAMGSLEKLYGKDITTRNWKTMLRIEKKLN